MGNLYLIEMTRQFVKFVSRQFGKSGSICWPSGPNRLSRHSNMFTASKAAQMAAVFVQRHGNTINLLKLMKLLYFADRESIAKYGFPISYDHIVSMDHGLVLSTIYNLMTGMVGGSSGAKWEEWISDREHHDVRLNREFGREDLDELSDANLEILEETWGKFGGMSQWELSDYAHEHCAEWEDPKGSSLPIKDSAVLVAVGFGPEEAEELGREIESQRSLDRALAEL